MHVDFAANTSGRDILKIERIINNNVVSAIDDNGKEVVLMGCGIGFKRRPGDPADASKVEKVFLADNEERNSRLMQLYAKIPEEHIQLSSDIIDYAKQHMSKQLSDNLYLSLTDHISMAIERLKHGIQLENSLLGEIEKNYSEEFSVGKAAVDMMNSRLGISLSYAEAGFIALHLVNGEIKDDKGV